MSNLGNKNLGEMPAVIYEGFMMASAETKALVLEMLDVEVVTPELKANVMNLISERYGND